MQAGLGTSPAFRVPEYQLQSTFELPLVLVLGALCGAVAAAFKVSSQVSSQVAFSHQCFCCYASDKINDVQTVRQLRKTSFTHQAS